MTARYLHQQQTQPLADGNTYAYAQRFSCYSGKHLYAFARGDGR